MQAVNTTELIPFFRPAAMPLPIVIADDSLLARKVLTKALPADWDIDVSCTAKARRQ
jgi:hypothetical protein